MPCPRIDHRSQAELVYPRQPLHERMLHYVEKQSARNLYEPENRVVDYLVVVHVGYMFKSFIVPAPSAGLPYAATWTMLASGCRYRSMQACGAHFSLQKGGAWAPGCCKASRNRPY